MNFFCVWPLLSHPIRSIGKKGGPNWPWAFFCLVAAGHDPQNYLHRKDAPLVGQTGGGRTNLPHLFLSFFFLHPDYLSIGQQKYRVFVFLSYLTY